MSDIPFMIWDKETAEIKNSKFAIIQNILDESNLNEEDVTLLTQVISEWAHDAIQDNEWVSDWDIQ